MAKPKKMNKPPNGGWGWVVVAGVAIMNSFNQSILSVFGLLFGEHLQNMGIGTTGAALVSNMNSLALNLSGLFIGPAIKTFAPRRVAFAGCFLTSFGLLMCSISTELWHVIVSYSVIVGLGLGLISPSAFMAINSYFTTKRGMAVGIAMAGTGIGQMALPHIVRYLLDYYGFRMTAVVLGSLALHGLVGACLFRPLNPTPRRRKKHTVKEVPLLVQNGKYTQKENISSEPDQPPEFVDHGKRKSLEDHEITFMNDKDEVAQHPKKRPGLCHKITRTLVNAMDLRLLKDPIFISLTAGIGLVYTSTINFSMLFPYFLQFSANLSRSDTAICMSALAGADIVCRIGFPMITDRLQMSYRLVFLLGAIGMFIGRAILAETSDFYTLIVLSAICGGFKSATVVNNNLAVSEYCSGETLAGALGLNMIAKAIFAITIGQFLGWIRDYTGSYSLSLHAQDALIVTVMVMWIPELVYKYLKKRHQTSTNRDRTNSINSS